MADAAAARAGPVFPAGVTAFSRGVTASTNDEARELAARGAPHLTVVWAEEQAAGRGRHRRPWRSPAGNAYWSLLLRPRPEWPDIGQLAIVTALAVHAAVRPHVGVDRAVTLKWPNDTLIDGRKVAGVLIEAGGVAQGEAGRATAEWVVVGVGLNVAHHPPERDVRYPATSLAAEGSSVERDQVLGDLTRAFLAVLDRWTRDGLAALRQEYAARAHGLGERIAIRMSEALEDTVGGIHRGVDEQGRLLVELDDGTIRTIAAGDVFLGVAGPDSARSEGRE